MDSELPTFFTSNLNIDELEIHLSQAKGRVDEIKARRIIERIKQLTEDLELMSENRRK
jgi:primosomal protein DnaI